MHLPDPNGERVKGILCLLPRGGDCLALQGEFSAQVPDLGHTHAGARLRRIPVATDKSGGAKRAGNQDGEDSD
jgi:hypothetical protein